MTLDDCEPCLSANLCDDAPTEILLFIFTFLPARQLFKARQVCQRWKQIIDSLARSDILWQDHCRNDFKEVYKIARVKCQPGLLWFNIYRSLSLWSRLELARETRDEFAAASKLDDEVRNFKILQNGVIGVHKRAAIVYYDLETLEQSKRNTIPGEYLHYTENESTLVIMGFRLELFVIQKISHRLHYDANTIFDNVKMFILMERDVYFVTLNDDIFMCKLEDSGYSSRFITHSEDGVIAFGHTDNRLNVLTFQRNIYTATDNNLEFVCTLDNNSNLMHTLNKYNFLERLDWRIYFHWMYLLNHSIPCSPLRNIIAVRTYGETIFVGSNGGVLRIYYAPYSNGELDIFNTAPVKQYNFMERFDCPVLSMCPIIQIDVSETEEGHMVIVAMPKKIAVLNFVHNFKETSSVAMLPYTDDKTTALKIADT